MMKKNIFASCFLLVSILGFSKTNQCKKHFKKLELYNSSCSSNSSCDSTKSLYCASTGYLAGTCKCNRYIY